MEVGTFDVAQLSRTRMEIVEADSFWCVCALLDTIQENYTFAQPGIQRKVQELKDLIGRVEPDLYHHFDTHGVEFLQFSFRWFNNLLMREIPLRATIRLWDTYLVSFFKIEEWEDLFVLYIAILGFNILLYVYYNLISL